MTIAYDAFSSATPGTGDLSWTHTPVGTPAGVLVYVIQNVGDLGELNAVTYGGQLMSLGTAQPNGKASGESGAVYLYYLDAGIPAGAQTVTVDVVAPDSVKAAVCLTLTGTPPVFLHDVRASISYDEVTNPVTLLGLSGFPGFCSVAFLSGADDVGSVSPQAGWTSRYEYDFGGQVGGVYTYDTVDSRDVYAGWLQTAEDAVALAAVFRELGSSPSPSLSPSASKSPSASPSQSPSVSRSPSISPSQSPSASLSPSVSPSSSLSPSASVSPSSSPSVSPTASASPSASPSRSPTSSRSPSTSRSPSASPSASPSVSLSPSASPSQSPSASKSPSASPSKSPSVSPSASPSVSPSPSVGPGGEGRPLGIWIDVETSAGVKLGAGPITSATGWQQTRRLDRAGTGSFSLSASDPGAALLTAKRVARCYGLVDGNVTEQGAIIIDRVEVEVGDPTRLRVSGDDLLRELTYRTCGELLLAADQAVTPDDVHTVRAFSPFDAWDLPDYYDGSEASSGTFNHQGDFWIYVGHERKFDYIRVIITRGNANWLVRPLEHCQYYTGGGWEELAYKDGTQAGGKSHAQTGDITFVPPDDWQPYQQTCPSDSTERTLYWVRYLGFLDCDIAEYYLGGQVATPAVLAPIMALAPAGWALDAVNGYTTTATAVFSQLADDTVLAALGKVAEITGEHFRLGSGRQVVWLRTDQPASGVRAIRGDGELVSLEGNPGVALVASLRKTSESYELASRVIPYGAGSGQARLTLADTTRSAPAGYTLSKTSNYLKADSAEVTYGQIERVMAWSDIGPLSQVSVERENAANALFDAALAWLKRNSAPAATYELGLVGCDHAILPGETVPVRYDEWVDGYHSVAVDSTLLVLEVTAEVDEAGVRTVGLVVSTVDGWPQSDSELMARQVRQLTRAQSYPQPQPQELLTTRLTKSGYAGMSTQTGGLAFWATALGMAGLSDTELFEPGEGDTLVYDVAAQRWVNVTSPRFVPLSTPLTSTAWDGDSYSTVGKTLIDVSAVFGAPAGVKALDVGVSVRDSGSGAATTGCYVILSPNNTPLEGRYVYCAGLANDAWTHDGVIVPCNGDGDIYYQINASGASTLEVYLQIWGYWT